MSEQQPIDWTKPVETIEEEPKPLRVLATDMPGVYPIVVSRPSMTGERYNLWALTRAGRLSGDIKPRVRNAPEPQKVIELPDRWENIYRDGNGIYYSGGFHHSYANAKEMRCEDCVATIKTRVSGVEGQFDE